MQPGARHKAFDWGRIIIAALAVALFYPAMAFADVDTGDRARSVGQVFCNTFRNSGGLPFLISCISYVVGGWVFIRGAFDLIKRSSDPNTPLRNGILGLIVGAFIVSLPYFVQFLHNTVFGDLASGYRTPTCIGSDGTETKPYVPLDEMLTNFVNNIKDPIMALISIMCIILGAAMIFWNMVRLSKFGTDAKTNALTPILGNLLIGALLVAVGQTLDVSLGTLFGGGMNQANVAKYSSIAYDPGGSFSLDRFNNAMKAVFVFLYIVGALSFVRGFFVLRNALDGQGQATKGQAFTHIIGGTLLVNMPGFIHVIERTMGFQILAP
ncbi:MAG: hypothetical protein HY053_00730 [Proteobacteria bacterium]|nr:hypothetical protein [Pseudomonadota bacterium]